MLSGHRSAYDAAASLATVMGPLTRQTLVRISPPGATILLSGLLGSHCPGHTAYAETVSRVFSSTQLFCKSYHTTISFSSASAQVHAHTAESSSAFLGPSCFVVFEMSTYHWFGNSYHLPLKDSLAVLISLQIVWTSSTSHAIQTPHVSHPTRIALNIRLVVKPRPEILVAWDSD